MHLLVGIETQQIQNAKVFHIRPANNFLAIKTNNEDFQKPDIKIEEIKDT